MGNYYLFLLARRISRLKHKSGFVTVIGRPNVGKSTLINKIVGEKVNIVTHKPQTTRNKLRAIYTEEKGQIIFVDTPGFHKAQNKLDKYMLAQIYDGLKGIDLLIFVLDANYTYGKGDNYIYKQIKNIDSPLIVALNKIDKVKNKKLLARVENYQKHIEQDIIPISARSGKNLDNLLTKIFTYLPEGPQYYPVDMYTDQQERFIIAELIREKIFILTRQEIPYGVAVLIEEIKDRETGKLLVRANIYVEKKSHKGIIIGKNGSMLKNIGRRAREDIEKLLNCEVYLDLWVKVQKDWREDETLLRRMGYRG